MGASLHVHELTPDQERHHIYYLHKEMVVSSLEVNCHEISFSFQVCSCYLSPKVIISKQNNYISFGSMRKTSDVQ